MYPHPSYVTRKGKGAIVSEQTRMKMSIEELLSLSPLAKKEYAK
jgi:hypothetical protein